MKSVVFNHDNKKGAASSFTQKDRPTQPLHFISARTRALLPKKSTQQRLYSDDIYTWLERTFAMWCNFFPALKQNRLFHSNEGDCKNTNRKPYDALWLCVPKSSSPPSSSSLFYLLRFLFPFSRSSFFVGLLPERPDFFSLFPPRDGFHFIAIKLWGLRQCQQKICISRWNPNPYKHT